MKSRNKRQGISDTAPTDRDVHPRENHLAPVAVQRCGPVCCIDATNDESSYTAGNPCTIMPLQTGLDSDGALGTAASLTGYELDICIGL